MFIFGSIFAWSSLFLLARVQPLVRGLVATDFSKSFGRCSVDIAFLSNAPEAPIKHKIVAFGSQNSLANSLLPSAVVTSLDPSVKASDGLVVSGLSQAVGRQPLRIQSHYLRLLLFNIGLIDSTVVPASLLKSLKNIDKKYIAFVGLCDECSANDYLNLHRYDDVIMVEYGELEKYLQNFYPGSIPDYKKYCKKR